MRFWLVHSSEVPIQDQIVAQVSLGVLSGELAPGQRLPSIRELARRFGIHANTVSLAYRRLERDLWLESRRGSGMYVRLSTPTGQPANTAAEHLIEPAIASLVRTARSLGLTAADLEQRLARALAAQSCTRFLLLEPDPALECIVLAELAPALRLPITGYTYPGQELPAIASGTTALVLPSKAAALRAALPASVPMHVLKVRSVPQSLAQWLPAPTNALVGIASHWAPFLDFARTMLIAAGFHPDALLLRNGNHPGWQHGLEGTDAVVCDTHTATLLPITVRAIPFRLLADQTLPELLALE